MVVVMSHEIWTGDVRNMDLQLLFLHCLQLILEDVAPRFLGDSGTRSCVMSVLNNYLSDYYALHTAFSLHLSLLGLLPLLLYP